MQNSSRPALRLERRGSIAWVTLDRPDRLNALNAEALCRLADAWSELDDDPAIRAVVLTGAGERAFCAGADLRTLIPLLAGDRRADDAWDERVLADRSVLDQALLKDSSLHKPLIAAVNGVAVAAGFELVLACDLRVAARTATFGLAEVRRGLVPTGGGVVRLSRSVPLAAAMDLLLTGAPIDADEAWRIGLVNRVVAPADVAVAAADLADALAANGPLAVAAIKRTVFESAGLELAAAFAVERRNGDEVLRSSDAREGARAFVEKRPPNFEGR